MAQPQTRTIQNSQTSLRDRLDVGTREVLLVSSDADLVAWVQGCAAGSGAGLRVVSGWADAAPAWGRHPLVLVGEEMLAQPGRDHLARHPQVHVVARSPSSSPRGAVHTSVALGVQSVIDLASGRHALSLLLEAVADPRPPGRVIAVAGGGSGAGASTTAAAVALVAARDRTVALLLPDPHGPDPWMLVGGDQTPGLVWADVARAGGALAPVGLRETLPRHRGVAVLGHGPGAAGAAPSSELTQQVLRSARAAFDLVVIDVDPRLDQVWSAAMAHADRVWMVVRPRAVGLASARARRQLAGDGVRVLLRGDGVPDDLAGRALGGPIAERMRDDRRLDEALDIGAGPVGGRRTPLRVAAARVLADLERGA